MIEYQPVKKTFLQPGALFFGDESVSIKTLLGSCVSITLWHKQRKMGGMCHYLLPSRKPDIRESNSQDLTKKQTSLDGRYADEAFEFFLKQVKQQKSFPNEYEAKIFGGANLLEEHQKKKIKPTKNIGQKNIEAGLGFLKKYGFQIKAKHVGGACHRNIIFDMRNGDVWVYYVSELRVSFADSVIIERDNSCI